ncbi:hypothetical protein [Pueribacillus sp. YX66]|uniref:hypothetical protein n=1 Tax=Pueribacillus sp. YX66 TaxID=3229242 RepID=UPI00358D01CE
MPYVDNYSHPSHIPHVSKEHCRRYIDYAVEIKMRDGRLYQAILIDVDDHNVTILTYESTQSSQMVRNENDERFFGPRFYPGFRFRRLLLPLAGIVALSTLPYFTGPFYPYPYYPYPYF